MRASGANRVSGVVTKWMPLFNVHVNAVGCCGMGTLRPLTPSTKENEIRKRDWKQQRILASNKDFTMCLSWLLLRPVFPNLLSILVLLRLEYSADDTNVKTHHVRWASDSLPSLTTIYISSERRV